MIGEVENNTPNVVQNVKVIARLKGRNFALSLYYFTEQLGLCGYTHQTYA